MSNHSQHDIAEARLGGGMKLNDHSGVMQTIARRWVEEHMAPRLCNRMVEDLLHGHNEEDEEEGSGIEIREAMRKAGNWQEECEQHGWERCEDIIERFAERMPDSDPQPDYLTLLYKLLNLIVDDRDCEDAPCEDDVRFAWVRTWYDLEGGRGRQVQVLTLEEAEQWMDQGETLTLAWASDCYSKNQPFRFSEDALSEIPGMPGVGSSMATLLSDLPAGYFVTGEELCKRYTPQVEEWITDEWLEPHTFVSFTNAEWSTVEDDDGHHWKALGEEQGYDVNDAEVHQWYMVDEQFSRNADEDEVIVELNGNTIWGRQGAGQALYMDGGVWNAMVRSGHFERVPALGLLNHDACNYGSMEIRLGGELYPFRFRVYNGSNLQETVGRDLLTKAARAAGAEMQWTMVRKEEFEPGGSNNYEEWGFRIVIPEGSDNPIWPKKIA